MFDINEVNDFIASNCLTHSRCPKKTAFVRIFRRTSSPSVSRMNSVLRFSMRL